MLRTFECQGHLKIEVVWRLRFRVSNVTDKYPKEKV